MLHILYCTRLLAIYSSTKLSIKIFVIGMRYTQVKLGPQFKLDCDMMGHILQNT